MFQDLPPVKGDVELTALPPRAGRRDPAERSEVDTAMDTENSFPDGVSGSSVSSVVARLQAQLQRVKADVTPARRDDGVHAGDTVRARACR